MPNEIDGTIADRNNKAVYRLAETIIAITQPDAVEIKSEADNVLKVLQTLHYFIYETKAAVSSEDAISQIFGHIGDRFGTTLDKDDPKEIAFLGAVKELYEAQIEMSKQPQSKLDFKN